MKFINLIIICLIFTSLKLTQCNFLKNVPSVDSGDLINSLQASDDFSNNLIARESGGENTDKLKTIIKSLV